MDPTEKTLKGIKSKIIYKEDCHIWSGTLVNNTTPYYNNKNVQKLLWSITNPPVKDKIECIKTTCKNHRCVKIEHMFVELIYGFNNTWEDALESILTKTYTDDDGCMIWTGCTDKEEEYGVTSFRGSSEKTHRVSYMIKIQSEIIPKYINGEITNVMHTCGKSLCVNPSHMELGTVRQNVAHKVGHGTHQRGETSKRATITEATAQKILDSKRKRGEDDYETQEQRAKRYGASIYVVQNIDRRQTWGHLIDSRNNTTSVRDKINARNREQLKLQKDITLTDDQYETAWATLKSKSTEVHRNGWDCLEYTIAPMRGYGQFCFYNITKKAHIWSCEIKNKRKREEGEVTMHLCNNPACVNPDHLEFGTHKENMVYAVVSGSKMCKLTVEDVHEIRQSDLSCAKLSLKYGVSEETVRRAKTGKSWTGVK